jgi:hypothetical protein
LSNIQIELIGVTVQTNPGKKAGTTYQSLDVAYINRTFKNKVEGRKIMAFGATAETFKTLSNATKGDVFDVEVVKNDAGYNDWVSAKKSDGSAASATNATRTAAPTSAGSTSPKSTYETPEERAKRQILIVRQSSLSTAVETLVVGAKAPPKKEEVVELAKYYESYVFGDNTAKVAEPETFGDLEDDVPL